MSVHPMASGSGPDRISMCPVRLRAVLLCSCVRRHTYRLALKLLHLEVWRQTDTKAPPPIPPTATCLTAQPGVPETAVCNAQPACMVPRPSVQGECPDLFQQRPIPCMPPPRIGITMVPDHVCGHSSQHSGRCLWPPCFKGDPDEPSGQVSDQANIIRVPLDRLAGRSLPVPGEAVVGALVPLGPRHDGLRWETPLHVVDAVHSVPSPSLFDVLSDTLGHDESEAHSHFAGPREADSMSQRAQSPAAQSPAAQWPLRYKAPPPQIFLAKWKAPPDCLRDREGNPLCNRPF